MAKKRYLENGIDDNGNFVRAFTEGRSEIAVQVWLKPKTPEYGEPDGDWAMPRFLGVATCIAQAVLQTKPR